MIVSFGYAGSGAPSRVKHVFDVRALTHDEKDPSFAAKRDEILAFARQHPGEDLAIGCELGQHRSRVLANQIATALRTSVLHRER